MGVGGEGVVGKGAGGDREVGRGGGGGQKLERVRSRQYRGNFIK